jgi:hypothetical protein
MISFLKLTNYLYAVAISVSWKYYIFSSVIGTQLLFRDDQTNQKVYLRADLPNCQFDQVGTQREYGNYFPAIA